MQFQPAVCTRELCVFSFYTLGVMSGAAEEVATGAEVMTSEQIAFDKKYQMVNSSFFHIMF